MSADNGVYILKTKDQYRVIYASAIDNLTWSYLDPNFHEKNPEKFVPSRILEYFGKSKYTYDKNTAMRVANGILKSLPVCEYGIVTIRYNKTWKQIKFEGEKYAKKEIEELKKNVLSKPYYKRKIEELKMLIFQN